MKNTSTGAKKILVVEDEPSITQVCQRVLRAEGFEVDVAANGKAGQDMIENKTYDLLLVDIRTPAMSGQELYEWLQEKHPQIAERVIFTTGDMMRGDTQTFLQKTGQPYVFSFGKEGRLIKSLLQVHDLATLQNTVKDFFRDDQCKRRGPTIGIFYQELNRLLGMKGMDPLEQAKRDLSRKE